MSAPSVSNVGVVKDVLFTSSSDGTITGNIAYIIDDNGVVSFDIYSDVDPEEKLKNFTFVEAYAVEVFDIATHEMLGHDKLIENFEVSISNNKKTLTDPKGQELFSLFDNTQLSITYDESLPSLFSIGGNFGFKPLFATSSMTIKKPVSETKTITDNQIVLTYTPVDPEDVVIRVISESDPVGKTYEYDTTASSGTFTINGNIVYFESGTTGTAMIDYEKEMTKGSVVKAVTNGEYPICELHVYIKVKESCSDKTYSGVWVFYRAQRNVTSVDINLSTDGKNTQAWETKGNPACKSNNKVYAAFFIDFDD